jgi:hypothetical protein
VGFEGEDEAVYLHHVELRFDPVQAYDDTMDSFRTIDEGNLASKSRSGHGG